MKIIRRWSLWRKKKKENKNRCRSLLRAISDTIARLDDNGVILEWITIGREIENFIPSPTNILGKSIQELFPDLAVEGMFCLKKAILSNKPQIFEYEFFFHEQKWFYEIRFVACGKGEVITTARNISEQKTVEEELRASERRFKDIANLLPSMICEIDKNYKLTYANKITFQTLGYGGNKIKEDISVVQIIHPADMERAHKDMQMILAGEEVGSNEYRLLNKDGKEITVLINSCPMYKNDKIVGIRNSMVDITQRKNFEEAIAQEKERLAVTVQSIGDGVIATDIHGEIVLINNAAIEILGWTKEESIGRSVGDIFKIINNKTGQPFSHPVEQVLNKKQSVHLDKNIALLNKQGDKRLITASGSPIMSRAGQIIGVVLVFQDITEKTLLEAEIIKVQKLESVGLLAGGIAHDFNNILAEILATLQLAKLLQEKSVDITRHFYEIERAISRAANLTKQLLTFAKGGVPVKKRSTIYELVKETVEFAVRGTNVLCKYNFPEEPWTVEVDEGQICQVINNLVINAIQAMPDGGEIKIDMENIEIGQETLLPLKSGRYIKLSVTDGGIGIPKEHLEKIFDPFFTTKAEGNGLGLTTSYSIVKKHDGYIAVDSEQGIGTSFQIYLPASGGPSINKKRRKETISKGAGKILLMDDEEAIRNNIKEILVNIGYQVATAKDGAEAVAEYKQAQDSAKPFDAVIMDLTVPGGMGGKEAIELLKEIDPGVKAIVSSGYCNGSVLSNYQKYGFSGVLIKPYTIEKLNKLLRKLIED